LLLWLSILSLPTSRTPGLQRCIDSMSGTIRFRSLRVNKF
jgi:hypothetical protein